MQSVGNNREKELAQKVHEGRILVLYDGGCPLCNGAVRWLLRRDRLDRLRFAPLEQFPGMAAEAGETVLVVGRKGAVLARSAAVLAALRELPQPWAALAAVAGLVPGTALDWLYRLVARNRFRFGQWLRRRPETCALPSEGEHGHFFTPAAESAASAPVNQGNQEEPKGNPEKKPLQKACPVPQFPLGR